MDASDADRKTHAVDLAELIQTAKGGRSYEQLSIDSGGRPGRQRLQQLATTKLKNFPDPDTIIALSKGLGVSQRAIVLASAESLGLDVSAGESQLEVLMPASARELSPNEVGTIISMIRSFHAVRAEYRTREDEPIDQDIAEQKVDLPMAAETDPYRTDSRTAMQDAWDAEIDQPQ